MIGNILEAGVFTEKASLPFGGRGKVYIHPTPDPTSLWDMWVRLVWLLIPPSHLWVILVSTYLSQQEPT